MELELKARLERGELDETLGLLYGEDLAGARGRCQKVMESFEAAFGRAPEALFSAPGRTELGGNHTDHQHGRVLAGSVNLDIIAAVAPNGENVVRLQSEGFPMDVVELSDLEVHPEKYNRSVSILRGIASWFAGRGCRLEGFNVYTTSSVFKGSGLSSSAALEVLLGNIFNSLFYENQCTPVQLAQIGQYAENVYFGKPSGLLDQMGSSVGGMVTIDFADNDHPIVEKIDFDFAAAGHALCIIDSGADHADLTDEYAAVTRELKAVCRHFGKEVLREVPEEDFLAQLPQVRRAAGDRGVLRAFHVYGENRRAAAEAQALREGDFDGFLRLVRESGRSSAMYLQNIVPTGAVEHQEMMTALALAERLLEGRGAVRVHGGGFAGTAQAFVPLELLERFKAGIEAALGAGSCHVVTIRPVGGVRLDEMK